MLERNGKKGRKEKKNKKETGKLRRIKKERNSVPNKWMRKERKNLRNERMTEGKKKWSIEKRYRTKVCMFTFISNSSNEEGKCVC